MSDSAHSWRLHMPRARYKQRHRSSGLDTSRDTARNATPQRYVPAATSPERSITSTAQHAERPEDMAGAAAASGGGFPAVTSSTSATTTTTRKKRAHVDARSLVTDEPMEKKAKANCWEAEEEVDEEEAAFRGRNRARSLRMQALRAAMAKVDIFVDDTIRELEATTTKQ
ncbi:hypothetical protein ACP4OV_016563 [Aristida adscensionis]